MINTLETTNVGPIADLKMDFGKRLNIITGDNGLGKTFILDLVWWALTRKWPRDINRTLVQGYMARPKKKTEGKISFSLTTNAGTDVEYASKFNYEAQAWTGRAGRPHNPGLVLYAMADGSFAVWDSARNYWNKKDELSFERQPAYVFAPNQVWDGLVHDGKPLCNGLIRDWGIWQQRENKPPFTLLKKLLKTLSPSEEKLSPGELTRISITDPRDMPTIRMPYIEESVPVVFASSAIRRVVSAQGVAPRPPFPARGGGQF